MLGESMRTAAFEFTHPAAKFSLDTRADVNCVWAGGFAGRVEIRYFGYSHDEHPPMFAVVREPPCLAGLAALAS
jgi:hypothetical protein